MPSKSRVMVGVFLVGGLLLFAFGLFVIGDRRLLFSESIELYTEFSNLSGLKNGAQVRVSGMDAGEVQEVTVPGGPGSKFRVKFRVLDEFTTILRSDSVATIQTDGLVGNKILAVGPGSEQSPPAEHLSTIPSREPLEFGDLMQQASDTVTQANEAVERITAGVEESVETLTGIGKQASELMVDVGGQVQRITTSGTKIAEQVSTVIDGVQEGQGTVGKLLKDEELYVSVKRSVDDVEQSIGNMRKSTDELSQMVADLKAGKVVENLEATVQNVRDFTGQAKDTLDRLKPKEGETAGVVEDLRNTLSNAREATADLAENMEAMKRNFLLRGFFKDRGFYDLNSVSLEEYRSNDFAPQAGRERRWIAASDLFEPKPEGGEQLSVNGKRLLDEAMADFVRYLPAVPIVVEGYATAGTQTEKALRSRERAITVRRYLMERFGLKMNMVGVMPMGAVDANGPDGRPWDGAAIVIFRERDRAANRTGPEMLLPRGDGWIPRIGGLPPESGFTAGIEAWESNLAGGRIDAGVRALGSLKKYEHGEAYVGAPRLANGRAFAVFNVRYRNYPEENYWGLGPDTEEAARTDFRLEDVDYSGAVGFRPSRRTRFGVTGGWLRVNTGRGTDMADPSIEERFTETDTPGLTIQPGFWHAGAFAAFDNRDNYGNPHAGGSYQFRWTYFGDRDLGRFSFRRYDLDLRHYFPLRDKLDTIAVRGLATFTDRNSDQAVPFYMQPTVGGGNDLRGFSQTRFRGNNALVLNLEYRREISPYFDLIAFGDAGKVFARSGDLGLSGLEGAAGAGGRVKFREAILLGVDLGWSREGPRLWLRASHAF